MKTVFPTSEIAHIWARQSQEHGKAVANIFFEGPKIYSYGRHFCIANIIKPGVVLFTTQRYSVSTARHINMVDYACNHMRKIYCANPDGSLSNNLDGFQARISCELDILKNDRKRPATKDQAKLELSRIVSQVAEYLEVTGNKLSKKLHSEFLLYLEAAKSEQAAADLQTKLDKREKKKQREEDKKRAQILADGKTELMKWRSGRKSNFVRSYSHLDLPVMLRATRNDEQNNSISPKDEIETSKGARVPYEQGRKLYTLIKAGRDVRGYDLNGYTVISLNGVLKVGCHEIERTEIDRFAKKEGW